MKVLIIEDDPHKLMRLETFVSNALGAAAIVSKRAYQSGLDEAIEGVPDIIVLDMSLPTYEITPTEGGGRSRPYGGREILDEIKRKGLRPRVIVVTGLPSFGEGDEKMSLEEMKEILARDFPQIYRSTVYYHASEAAWQGALEAALRKAAEEV